MRLSPRLGVLVILWAFFALALQAIWLQDRKNDRRWEWEDYRRRHH